jgi:hypothetical protein
LAVFEKRYLSDAQPPRFRPPIQVEVGAHLADDLAGRPRRNPRDPDGAGRQSATPPPGWAGRESIWTMRW